MKKDTHILELIEQIFDDSKDCQLKHLVFESQSDTLHQLQNKLNCSKIEAFFIANVFFLSLTDEWISINDLKKHFDCKIIDILEFNKDLFTLFSSYLFEQENFPEIDLVISSQTNFKCSGALNYKIKNNDINSEFNRYNGSLKKANFLENLLIFIARGNTLNKINVVGEEINISNNTDTFFEEFKAYPDHEYYQDSDFKGHCKTVFAFTLYKELQGANGARIDYLCELIYGEKYKYVENSKEFRMENHFMIDNMVSELKKLSKSESITISNKDQKQMRQVGFEHFSKAKYQYFHIIKPEEIEATSLLHNEDFGIQINQLRGALSKETLKYTQITLAAEGMSKRITAIIFGPPNSGKTQIVKQLAKSRERQIMEVDFSKTVFSFEAKSQKVMHDIFKDYKDLCTTCDELPILFFNRMSHLFESNLEYKAKNMNHMANKYQATLFELLKDFEGIFIVASQYEADLFPVFERLFLFKIEIEKPNIQTQTKIWKFKIRGLSEKNARFLAVKYDFSINQINRAVRRMEVFYDIENPSYNDFEKIVLQCEEEALNK
jgi:SpoVK/Ycf46/Vps4 family AAA+-type ATPase